MKNIFKIVSCAALIFGLMVFTDSCRKNFSKINDDPNNPKIVPTSFLLTGAEKGIMDNTWDRWWNGSVGMMLAQYWAENVYTDESQYLFRAENTNSYWNLFYAGGISDQGNGSITASAGGLKELQQIIDLCNSSGSTYAPSGDVNNQKAIAMILQVWLYQNMTDMWGDIPFSEALKDVSITQPKYDKQRDVYLGLIARLDTASKLLNESVTNPVQGDVIYNGSIPAWRKFLNSLLLRVAIRIADREPALSSQKINQAIAAGVFTSNADNALFSYITGVPNNNPLYYDRFISGRQDFCGSDTLINMLKHLSDGRLGYYFDTAAAPGLGYVGRPYGQKPADAANTSVSNVSAASASHAISETSPGVYMDYAQVEFILAEAVERGFISGTAKAHYNNAINASWSYWTGSPATTTYLTQARVDYDLQKTAGKTWKQIIGQQKWLALYLQGVQGWVEWKRLDFGILYPPVGGILSGSGIPLRMTYPSFEQSVNTASYNKALADQGADALSTRLWWDMY